MRVELNIQEGEVIIPASGIAKDAITAEQFRRYPEKYIHLYPHVYKNLESLRYRLATQNTSIKREGKHLGIAENKEGQKAFVRQGVNEAVTDAAKVHANVVADQHKKYLEMMQAKGLGKQATKAKATRTRRTSKK